MKVQCGNIGVAYTVEGEGAAVVMVHGLAEDRSSSWSEVQLRLHGYKSFAYDLRGHGETTLGSAEGTLDQLGGDLHSFLEEVSGPAACIGYSLGGAVVLWAARKRPDLVRHAVLAGTSTVVGRAAVAFFGERIRALTEDRRAFEADFRKDNLAQLVNRKDLLDSVVKRRLAAIGDGGGYINGARAMMKLAGEPLTPLLAELECPLDIIQADQDAFCPRKAADIMRGAKPDAGYYEITDAGHLMSVDQPAVYVKVIQTALNSRRALQ